jgi:hypothetical protein
MTSIDDLSELNLDDIQIDEAPAPVRTRKPRSDAGVPRTAGGRMSRGALAEQLLIPWAGLTLAVSQPLPLVGAVLADRGEATTKALVELASGHPKMMAALKKAAKAGPASELVQTGAMLLLAVAIETGRVPAEAALAKRSGLTAAYYQLHPERAPQQDESATPFTDTPFAAPGVRVA